ncbi:hypothetical protein D5086_004547 [Populus alba]|uniref:Uncharacterized protein n=1 Tax=Populus alba TaxID=43335 RepID=A0ACC4CQS3_POPAL
MATPASIELRFRLPDGNDIGPNNYTEAANVATLKEHVIEQWPKVLQVIYELDDFILIFTSPTCNNSGNFGVYWDIKDSGRNGNQLDLDNLPAKLVELKKKLSAVSKIICWLLKRNLMSRKAGAVLVSTLLFPVIRALMLNGGRVAHAQSCSCKKKTF